MNGGGAGCIVDRYDGADVVAVGRAHVMSDSDARGDLDEPVVSLLEMIAGVAMCSGGDVLGIGRVCRSLFEFGEREGVDEVRDEGRRRGRSCG